MDSMNSLDVEPRWLYDKLNRVAVIREREEALRTQIVQRHSSLDRWCTTRIELLPLREDRDDPPRYRVITSCLNASWWELEVRSDAWCLSKNRYQYRRTYKVVRDIRDFDSLELAYAYVDHQCPELMAVNCGLILG